MCVYIYIHTHICIWMDGRFSGGAAFAVVILLAAYMYVCIYVHISIYMCIYIYV